MSREGQEKASDTQERTVDRLVLFIDYLRAKNIVKTSMILKNVVVWLLVMFTIPRLTSQAIWEAIRLPAFAESFRN